MTTFSVGGTLRYDDDDRYEITGVDDDWLAVEHVDAGIESRWLKEGVELDVADGEVEYVPPE